MPLIGEHTLSLPDFLDRQLAEALARELTVSAWESQNTVDVAEAQEIVRLDRTHYTGMRSRLWRQI